MAQTTPVTSSVARMTRDSIRINFSEGRFLECWNGTWHYTDDGLEFRHKRPDPPVYAYELDQVYYAGGIVHENVSKFFVHEKIIQSNPKLNQTGLIVTELDWRTTTDASNMMVWLENRGVYEGRLARYTRNGFRKKLGYVLDRCLLHRNNVKRIYRNIPTFVCCDQGVLQIYDGRVPMPYPGTGELYNVILRNDDPKEADIIRDVLGNPFMNRSNYSIKKEWLEHDGGRVLEIANGIREGKVYANLTVLADALEEAGCDDYDLLEHCRHPNHDMHDVGCWVLEEIKELTTTEQEV